MRVAVTGSSGLIGAAAVKRLRSEGHEVLRIVRPDTRFGSSEDARPSPSQQQPAPTVRWDPQRGAIDGDSLEGCDAVLHLAGEPIGARRWSLEQKRRISDSRVRATSLLAEALAGLEAPPGVLLSASAVGYYGSRGDEVVNEQSQPGDDYLSQVCRDWEAAAQPARDAGIRVVHPRTGVVLDKSGGALAEMLPFFRLGLGGRIGGGRQWVSWITLHDEVAALRWLLDADVEGPVNLCAPSPVTNIELTSALGRALRRPTFLPTPKPALWAKLGRELTEALLYASSRVEPAVLMSHGFEFSHRDISAALQAVLA